MNRFIILHTYIKRNETAFIANDVKSVGKATDSEGRVYTLVKLHDGTWFKAKESVAEIVGMIHKWSNFK